MRFCTQSSIYSSHSLWVLGLSVTSEWCSFLTGSNFFAKYLTYLLTEGWTCMLRSIPGWIFFIRLMWLYNSFYKKAWGTFSWDIVPVEGGRKYGKPGVYMWNPKIISITFNLSQFQTLIMCWIAFSNILNYILCFIDETFKKGRDTLKRMVGP